MRVLVERAVRNDLPFILPQFLYHKDEMYFLKFGSSIDIWNEKI